jgi:hypothetical protein
MSFEKKTLLHTVRRALSLCALLTMFIGSICIRVITFRYCRNKYFHELRRTGTITLSHLSGEVVSKKVD